uniref:Uncharacterized protein At4g30180 n=2 Tax=Anthurium amnicola TaxID=1678845 RepID=A0A1D1ZLI3_9ARAE
MEPRGYLPFQPSRPEELKATASLGLCLMTCLLQWHRCCMLSPVASMAKTPGSKRTRLCTFEPNMVMLASFSHRYMAYLLLALFKVGTTGSCRGNKDKEIGKTVRFEVDMALVVSASGFAWSRALRVKLEQGMDVKKLCWSSARQLITSHTSLSSKQKNGFNMVEMLDQIWTVPLITVTLSPAISHHIPVNPKLRVRKADKSKRVGWSLNPKRKVARRDEELCCCIRTLRRILPGGNVMGVGELLSEVRSYVICLEMQVSILRSLLDVQ